MKEEKTLNALVNKAGGNASKNAMRVRIPIPKEWADKLKVSQENREFKATFQEDGKIILEKI